ncbi:hypothetical protein [Carnobacterium divergens]|uniref:Integral membrane protein n=1 Tax=Carnobacterium divergens TaxID=2748 RepID=A0AAW8RFI0_CARDV|nr:hypothetical protein [Carnobacterium divergens]MDT1959005.1 hypothetical protein [Carnobacterium divergens]MDT1974973.1 hypothetical protein [Carnobacterium divergens]MDT2012937.1 hypothetical protein [Carnobacterium divergens]
MYVSYIPKIMDNLNGTKGNPIHPLVAGINCSLWVAYAILKKPRDLPLSIANFPSIIFGFVTFYIAL